MEEATMKSSGTMKKWHRLASSSRATQRAKGTDPRRLWIPEEVGCHLQEGVLSCSSGTAQGKLWTAEGIGPHRNKDGPQYKSGTPQGTWASEIRKRRYCTKNPEGSDVQDEMLESPECKMGRRNPDTRWQLHLKIKRTSEGINKKAFGLELMKKATVMSSGLRKIRNWALWRGWASSNWKKRLHTE
jgi:hypothetical protein